MVVTTRFFPAIFLLFGACARGGPDKTVTIRDSAGISIVEAPGQAWSGSYSRELEPTPSVQIGTVDADPVYQFFRIGGVGRLSSGEVVVANTSTQELRWFDRDGRFLRSVGRAGEGPGEYRGMRRLLILSGDSVLVEDGLKGQMNLYTSSGELRRMWPIAKLGPFVTPSPIGRFLDGHFAALTERELSPPPGHVHLLATLVRYRDGSVVDTITQFPGSETFLVACGPRNSGICNVGVPFAQQAIAVVAGTQVIAGNGDTYQLNVYVPGRGLVALYRRNLSPPPLTKALVGRYLDSLVSQYPLERRAIVRARLDLAPIPTRRPAYDQLIVDDQNNLWVRRPSDGQPSGRPWDVFNARGEYLGETRLPYSLSVAQIGRDYVLGIAKDSLDVEYVQLYRFVR